MRRALLLARRGFTPPNPLVGCVLVRGGEVVGEGWHRFAGAPHAEAEALAAAGERARDATAYVTLEPCAHFGRTPPCADALIRAGVRRVVAAVSDPDPRTAGAGLERLRAAGLDVACGLLEPEARAANAPFFHFHATGTPHVTLKAAVTLDGKIATASGDARWVTGAPARRFAHRLRARAGAVLCGIGTVLADDPLLTARIRGVPRQPLRVILDTRLRTPAASQLARTAAETPTLIVAGTDAPPSAAQELRAAGIEILLLATDNKNRIPLGPLLAELARRRIISVLVEGGGEVHAAFLKAGCVQRLLWFVAPKIAGGRHAPTSVGGAGAKRMAEALPLAPFHVRRMGADLLLESKPVPM